MKESKMFICECHSYSHQACFWWDEELKSLRVTIHLTTYKSFLKRLWRGLRYAFGYTSNLGDWDEFLFKPEDAKELHKFLTKLK